MLALTCTLKAFDHVDETRQIREGYRTVTVRIEVAGQTDVGRKRAHNEDSFAVYSEHGLYMVADGMGGHASGEVASRMAIETMRDFFAQTSGDPEKTWPYKMDRTKDYDENRLVTGIMLSNLRIFQTAKENPKQRGMGTTLAVVFAVEEGMYVAHVGDSRVYRIRGGRMTQLTEDHSLLNDYKKMKNLSAEEIEAFPHKNVIVRALGMKDTVKVDSRFESPEPGDIILLCSDGLAGPVSDQQIHRIIESSPDLATAAQALIEAANENGGPDNITAVLTQWCR
jgi:protein phosphatase